MGFDRVMEKCFSKIKDEEGATTVEYALLIAVIVVGIIGAATAMFPKLKTFFEQVVDKITKLAK
jgi:Flp pilus assembly pilin Flp